MTRVPRSGPGWSRDGAHNSARSAWPDDPLGRPSRLPDPEMQPEFYAHVPLKRFVAWLVDLVPTVLITLGILAAMVVSVVGILGTFLLPVIYVAVSLAYRTVMVARFGATVGMWMAAITLRRRDDTFPDPMLAFLHALTYSLAVMFVVPQIINVAVMALSRDGRGLFDYMLGTAMINRAERQW